MKSIFKLLIDIGPLAVFFIFYIRNGNIQAAYLFKADDSTDDKTNFNLIIVI